MRIIRQKVVIINFDHLQKKFLNYCICLNLFWFILILFYIVYFENPESLIIVEKYSKYIIMITLVIVALYHAQIIVI